MFYHDASRAFRPCYLPSFNHIERFGGGEISHQSMQRYFILLTRYIQNSCVNGMPMGIHYLAESKHYAKICLYLSLKISNLTSEYYHLIPRDGFSVERITPLHTPDQVKDEWKHVETLLELERASKVLAGAQYRIKGIKTTCIY